MTLTHKVTSIERPRPREMHTAHHVQARLRPRMLPHMKSLDYDGCCLTSHAVGGDFYDFLELGPDRLALVLGDVSGKGVPAALLMAALQATLRSHYALRAGGLEQRIASVHRQFFECTATQHYATLFVGEFDDRSGRLRYANCGQVPPLLVRADGSVARLDPTATALGLFERWTGGVAEVTLGAEDTLVLASDGILETTSSSGEEYGEARLLSAVRRRPHLGPAPLIESIARELRFFRGKSPRDDQTLVVAKVKAD